MGRISGPHTLPPFPNLFISPLGVVPKKYEGEIQVNPSPFLPCNISNNYVTICVV